MNAQAVAGLIGNIVFGARCPVCMTEVLDPARACCPRCASELTPTNEPRCPRCALRLGPYVEADKVCASCRTRQFPFRSAAALFGYHGAVQRQIQAAKFRREWHVARSLAATFARGLTRDRVDGDVDVIVPVPMFWWERRRRGTDLAGELASALAAAWRVELAPRALKQTRPAAPQYTLDPAQRRRNVEGLFAATGRTNLKGRAVLLVDDVLTTGATASEASRALRRAGAAEVRVAVLARTESGQD